MDREQDIHFVYENGVFKPDEPVNLPDGTRGIAHIRTNGAGAESRASDTDAWRKAQKATLAQAWDNDENTVYDRM